MSVLGRVSGLCPRDKGGSSAIGEELGVEPPLLGTESRQMGAVRVSS